MAEKQILAIVTKNRDKVGGTGPIFYAESDEELEHTATLLARVLAAAIHDLDNGSVVIVRH